MNGIFPDMLLLADATHSMSKQFQTYLILRSVFVTVVCGVIWHLFQKFTPAMNFAMDNVLIVSAVNVCQWR